MRLFPEGLGILQHGRGRIDKVEPYDVATGEPIEGLFVSRIESDQYAGWSVELETLSTFRLEDPVHHVQVTYQGPIEWRLADGDS